MAKKIVAGNWKMNLTSKAVFDLVGALNDQMDPNDVRVVLFPTSLYVLPVSKMNTGKFDVGVQNFHFEEKGAFTGEVSIEQVKSVGGKIGLIGHSERRIVFHEDHAQLKLKVDRALQADFEFIFCCGEPLEVRENEQQLEYVKVQLEESLFHLTAEQMKGRIIAYEPVWAIGTGKTASSDQAEAMHASIRGWLIEKYGQEVAESVSILYGGSCNPKNAEELFACNNVDGGLIGGASLNADDFCSIISAF